jgi:hypothetical protein
MTRLTTGYYKTGQEVAKESLAKQVGALLASGLSFNAVAKEMRISARKVVSLSNTEQAKRVMIDMGSGAVESARLRIKAGAARLSDKILETIEHHLDEKNIHAVPIALKVLGFGEEQGDSRPTSFTVVLPGAEVPKDVTAAYEEIQDVSIEPPISE